MPRFNSNSTGNSNLIVNSNETDLGNREFLSNVFVNFLVIFADFRVLLITCCQVNESKFTVLLWIPFS